MGYGYDDDDDDDSYYTRRNGYLHRNEEDDEFTKSVAKIKNILPSIFRLKQVFFLKKIIIIIFSRKTAILLV